MTNPYYAPLTAVLLLLLSPEGRPLTSLCYGQSPPRPITWEAPNKYIAGTPRSRMRALRDLGAIKGRGVLAYLSINCGDCDRVARALNKYVPDQPPVPDHASDQLHILGVAQGPQEHIDHWSTHLGLRYAVRSVTDATMEDLGAVTFPTLVFVVDGVVKGSRCPALEEGWR